MTQKQPLRFSRQVSWTLAARILSVGASVATGALIARTLGVEGVGVFAVVTLTVNSLVQILGAGLASASLFFAKRQKEVLPRIISNGLVFAAIAGSLGGMLAYGLFLVRPDWFNDIPSDLFLIALVMLPFQVWTLFGLNIFFGTGEVRLANILDSSGQLMTFINALVVLLLIGSGLYLLITVNAATAVILAALIAFLLLRAEGSALGYPDLGLFGQMMKFGLRINIMNAAMALILRADVLLVNYFHGQGEAGIYSVAAQCSLLLIMFPNVVGTMLFPNVAGMDAKDSAPFSANVIRHTAAVQLMICIVSVPFAFLLPFVYGEAFGPATFQFLVLLPGALMMGLQMMLSQHLVGIGRFRVLPYLWVVTLLISVSLNLWLVPTYGAMGAAVVSTIAYAVIFSLTLGLFHKETGQSVSSVLFLRFAEARKLMARFGW